MVKERDHRIIEKELSSLVKNFHFITLVSFLIVDYYYIPCSRVYMHAQLIIRLTFLELSLTSFFLLSMISEKNGTIIKKAWSCPSRKFMNWNFLRKQGKIEKINFPSRSLCSLSNSFSSSKYFILYLNFLYLYF